MMHEKGIGVPRDLKQAAFWYERAALAATSAPCTISRPCSPRAAAASRTTPPPCAGTARPPRPGFRDSQFNLGILLARGIGSKPDLPKAFQWFSLAAAQGDEEAARKRDEIAARLERGRNEGREIRSRASGARAPVDPIANTAAGCRRRPDRLLWIEPSANRS